MTNKLRSLLLLAVALPLAAASSGVLPARWHDSGFPDADDNYNALYTASDGRLYYVLCAHKIDVGASMFSFDPATRKVTRLADLTEASGEKGLKAVPQGKSHVGFYEWKGKLYFATHLGYYNYEGSKELAGVPPKGYNPYPGGHFLAYDMSTGKVQKLASAPKGEGILTMTMDTVKQVMYALTWPSGYFLRYDLATNQVRNFGLTAGEGERGTGSNFRVICRAIVVDPVQGAFFTTSTGDLMHYSPRTDQLEKASGISLKRPILGEWDPDKPGHMGYNWRQMVYYPPEKAFYGTHGNSGYLFRFDAWAQQFDFLERIAAEKTRSSGLYDEFAYGYLSLTLGPDGHTLYFLTGTPKGEEIRLVTYDIPTRRYTDHGAIVLDDGSRPNWAQSIAVGPDKRVYTVSKLTVNGKLKVELLSFPDPLQASVTPPAPRYERVHSWLNPTGGKNPLKEVHGLCVDNDGHVIVVDSIGSRVQRFTIDGRFLNEIGLGPGSGPGEFKGPRDARVHRPTGEIFVSDANNYRIQVFTHDGRFLRQFGEKGSAPGQLLRAHGLEFSPDFQRLYAVDVDNNRVSVFAPSGKFLFTFGQKGYRTGEFRQAHGIGVAADGDVLVTGYFGPTTRFTADGKFKFEFAPGGFQGWTHFHSMTADRHGWSYLAARDVKNRNSLLIFDHRGAFITSIVPFSDDRERDLKTAFVDAAGLVYIAVESKGIHGVQVFRKLP
jgi:DNA-binding beta-propeller fold protein YncE